jgi:hypothetical protein
MFFKPIPICLFDEIKEVDKIHGCIVFQLLIHCCPVKTDQKFFEMIEN